MNRLLEELGEPQKELPEISLMESWGRELAYSGMVPSWDLQIALWPKDVSVPDAATFHIATPMMQQAKLEISEESCAAEMQRLSN